MALNYLELVFSAISKGKCNPSLMSLYCVAIKLNHSRPVT